MGTKFKIGDRIHHRVYGVGIIIGMEEDMCCIELECSTSRGVKQVEIKEKDLQFLNDAVKIGDRIETTYGEFGTIEKIAHEPPATRCFIKLDRTCEANQDDVCVYLYPCLTRLDGFAVLGGKKAYRPRVSMETIKEELKVSGYDVSKMKDEDIKELMDNIVETIELWRRDCGYCREI